MTAPWRTQCALQFFVSAAVVLLCSSRARVYENPASRKKVFPFRRMYKIHIYHLSPVNCIFTGNIAKMVRKLKHHEQKLLRKVDFTTYKSDHGHRDAAVIRRYAIQKPSDYGKYNKLSGVCSLISQPMFSVHREAFQYHHIHLLTSTGLVLKTTRTPTCRSSPNFNFQTDS